ncbi:unnamed protein product, partial [Polarella glacialis]
VLARSAANGPATAAAQRPSARRRLCDSFDAQAAPARCNPFRGGASSSSPAARARPVDSPRSRSPPPSSGQLMHGLLGEEEEIGMSAAEMRSLASCIAKREDRLRSVRDRRPDAEAEAEAAAME